MADDLMTLARMVTINDQRVADLDVMDIFLSAPMLAALPADTASDGNTHKYLKVTGAPVVGFRVPNTGREYDVSESSLVTVTLAILAASTRCDKSLADIYRKGGATGYIARENAIALAAALKGAERQIIYGTGNDSGGFTGLFQNLNLLNHDMVIGAGCTTANSTTSVIMMRATPDMANATVIVGNDGQITQGDTVIIEAKDADGKAYPAYYTPIEGWVGMQFGSAVSCARLANIDGTAGASSNTLNDDLLADLFECFPEEAPPTHIFCNKRAATQLKKSRTATSPTGAPAPYPTEWEGIPIITTSSIKNTEAVVAAS